MVALARPAPLDLAATVILATPTSLAAFAICGKMLADAR